MITQSFSYYSPSDIDEAASILASLGSDAAVLGGGTMLVPTMSANKTKIRAVVSLTALQLNTVTLKDGYLCLGAMASYSTILTSPLIASKAPLLLRMAEQITGGRSIQNQGTIGGSACYANPASDVPSCLVAMQATFQLHSAAGSRLVTARDFFTGAFATARKPDELLTYIFLPVLTTVLGARYDKHKFCTSSWPIVTSACTVYRDSGARETFLHLSLGGAATTPVFQRLDLSNEVIGNPDRWIQSVAEAMTSAVQEGWSDELADSAYRLAIVPAVVRRTLQSTIKELAT